MRKKHKFDVVILGGHLNSVYLATLLEKHSLKVCWVEDHIPVEANSLEMIPKDSTSTTIDELQSFLGHPLHQGVHSLPPLTFENGRLIPFVGFGDRKLASIDVLQKLTLSDQLNLLSPPLEWASELSDKFYGQRIKNSEITQLREQDKKVTAAELNGDTLLEASFFVLNSSPKNLLDWLPAEVLPLRWKQKVARTKTFDQVGLQFLHPKIQTEQTALHFLMGNKDDFEPCLGRFFRPNENGEQISFWESPLLTEDSEKEENVHRVISYMKRQIKRAYPEALKNTLQEKITLVPERYGFFDLKDSTQAPQFKNLFLGSALLSTKDATRAQLSQAQHIQEKITSQCLTPQKTGLPTPPLDSHKEQEEGMKI